MAGIDKCSERFFDGGLEEDRRLMFVKQLELRIDAGFDGKLVEQPRTESVNGRDHASVESPLVTYPTRPFITGAEPNQRTEFGAQPLAHLVRGAIGKRDCDYLIDRDILRSEDVQVSFDQDRSLTGSRTRGHGNMPA